MQKQTLKLYTVRLMPTEEAARSLRDMSARISRGIKENMQRKSHWKDKCVGSVMNAQPKKKKEKKRKPSLGINIKFFIHLEPAVNLV